MNDEEYGLLLDKMQGSGQSRQNVMISALKEATITTEEEIGELMHSNSLMADLLKQIRGMATNMNQMAHMANATGQIASINELVKLNNQISDFRKEGESIWQLIRQSISQ